MAIIRVWPGEWASFFDDFAEAHVGWLVKLQVMGAPGAQTEVDGMPLQRISFDRDGGLPAVEITIADQRGAPVTHTIDDVSHVWVKTGDEEEMMELDAPGRVALVTLRAATGAAVPDGARARR